MNTKSKCKGNQQMTVTSITSHTPKSPYLQNIDKQVFDLKRQQHLLTNSTNVSSPPPKNFKYGQQQRPDQSSSIILRQKLLHRNKNGSIVGVSGNTLKNRRSYSRSHNNGFKFHNFVVNEDKRSCLEEQHGTKKITVSHWKRPNNTIVSTNDSDTQQTITQSNPSSHSILETLLAPNSSNDISNQVLVEDKQRLSKRKPLHVRRVLRQHQRTHNMSIDLPKPRVCEPQVEPLDLSFKKINFSETLDDEDSDSRDNCLDYLPSNDNFIQTICNNDYYPESESVQNLINSVNQSAAQASAIIASVKCPIVGNSLASNVIGSHTCNDSSISDKKCQNNSVNCVVASKQMKQRQTHRSIIKKQLEETFKQNGFLVKTKQVSDANNSAMFCKFRQLRKYTRYYLKSWHHHLPDEVNKLWKGFLPPKTEKPNSSH
ncbi:uncharacterized protein LOC128964295 [Oppia nitens]|uniref:uncharacterized protein LOC128964295 n=1 Tax=Oppia nitens TaxID=1686743 RepID=UPI0023DA5293|nr:uncharacterized protein LOC128964295 [Oppia nitens]